MTDSVQLHGFTCRTSTLTEADFQRVWDTKDMLRVRMKMLDLMARNTIERMNLAEAEEQKILNQALNEAAFAYEMCGGKADAIPGDVGVLHEQGMAAVVRSRRDGDGTIFVTIVNLEVLESQAESEESFDEAMFRIFELPEDRSKMG